MAFQKATKKQSKLRCALFGISGSGKTFSALSIGKGLGTNIAVIDTERGSASKYSDRFSFDVCELKNRTIDGYISAIKDAEAGGYDVLIIDSMSHAWEELLTEVDKLAATKYKGNSFRAWSEGTPKQRKFVDAILNFNGHLIATMRSKTEWSVENKDGKMTPQRVGLTPEQGKGIEYEFDLLLEMNGEHYCSVLKDRTGKFQDVIIEKPGESFGKELKAWLMDGELPQKQSVQQNTSEKQPEQNQFAKLAFNQIIGWVNDKHITDGDIMATIRLVDKSGVSTTKKTLISKLSCLEREQIEDIIRKCQKVVDAKKKNDLTEGTGFDPNPVEPPVTGGEQ